MGEVPDGKSFWILHMTIHDIYPVPNPDASYSVKWARGSKKGKTEYVQPSNSCAVFGTELSVPCTIIRRKGKTEEKQMLLVAKMREGKKSKQIGEFKMDLAPFVGLSAMSEQSFCMKSATSFAVKLSIKMTRTTQHSDFDSSMGTDDSELQKKRKPLLKIRSGSLRRKTMTMGTMVPMAAATGGEKPAVPIRASGPLHAQRLPAPMRKSFSSVQRIRFSDASEDTDESERVKVSKGPAFEEIKNLCAGTWNPTEAVNEMFHGLDALLYAALIHFKVLDASDGMSDDEFNDFVSEYWNTVKGSKLIVDMPDDTRFLAVFGLYILLLKCQTGDKFRRARIANMMRDDLVCWLSLYLDSSMKQFAPVRSEIFGAAEFDVDALASRMIDHISELRKSQDTPMVMSSYLVDAIIQRLDTQLVRDMCSSDGQCTFLRSLAWNTFCSRVQSEADFVRFREAVAVVQMTQIIDDDPTCVKDLCPHLDPRTVLAILSVRELDDDMKVRPNIAKFSSCFNLQSETDEYVTPFDAEKYLDIRNSFNDIPPDEWKAVCIPSQFFEDFPFLLDYFRDQRRMQE